VICAFVNEEPRLYTIDFAFSLDKTQTTFRYTRWVVRTEKPPERTPRFGLAGSGAFVLTRQVAWRRDLLRLVKAYGRHRVGARTVADALAAVNLRVSQSLTDGTVGPRCIVAWRNRKKGTHEGGGGHQTYTGISREQDIPSLPSIATGVDMHAFTEAMMPHMLKQTGALHAGNPSADLDWAALDEDIARLPDTPDEKLR
jgi:hypothetical protein